MQVPSQQAAGTVNEVFQPSGFNMVQLLRMLLMNGREC